MRFTSVERYDRDLTFSTSFSFYYYYYYLILQYIHNVVEDIENSNVWSTEGLPVRSTGILGIRDIITS